MSEKKSKEGKQEENSIGIEIPLSAAAGVLYGIGAIFLKQVTESFEIFNILSLEQWSTLLGTPAIWGVIIAMGLGLLVWFWALSIGRVAVVGPFMSGFMVIVPVIAGLTYFEEDWTWLKGVGILAITVGGMILSGRS